MGNFKEDIARTEAFVFDVDGVMTDGGIIPTLDGDFIRRYNAKDGYALAYAIKMGYKVCIITGGRGKTLENRLKMLGVTRAYIDCMDKISALHEYFAEEGIDPRNAIYMGDDIPDLECMREVDPGLPGRRSRRSDRSVALRLRIQGRRRGRARHRRAGAPRPRRLGQKLRGRDSLVAGRLAVSCRRERRGRTTKTNGTRPEKGRQHARKQNSRSHDRLFPYPQEPHPQKSLYCIHSTFAASRNSRLSGRTRLSASGAKMNRTLSTGTVRKTVEG